MRVMNAADYHEPRDAISHDWIKLVDSWGMEPVCVPNTLKFPEAYLKSLRPDLLILTGGDDLGKTPVRDTAEMALLAGAIDRRLPVLGVCRGMQLINSYFGGTCVPIEGHVAANHEVRLENDWCDIYGDLATVNSFHNQGLTRERLGDGLTVAATDKNGGIEAFFHHTYSIAAVMWHPERHTAPAGDKELVTSMAMKQRGGK